MKFEYLKLNSSDDGFSGSIPELNKMGQDGWELVGIVTRQHQFSTIFYFKSQLIEDEEPKVTTLRNGQLLGNQDESSRSKTEHRNLHHVCCTCLDCIGIEC